MEKKLVYLLYQSSRAGSLWRSLSGLLASCRRRYSRDARRRQGFTGIFLFYLIFKNKGFAFQIKSDVFVLG